MRDSVWNILTAIFVVAIILVAAFVVLLVTNPYRSINPLPPPPVSTPLVLPTSTPTLRQLPPTWTPTQLPWLVGTGTPQPRDTYTPAPTSTGFVISTFTPTFTNTPTASNTPTATRTPTNTPRPTSTNTRVPPTATNTPVPPTPTNTATVEQLPTQP